MSIIKKLQSDQLIALKQGDKLKLNTIRYILSKIKNKQIELRNNELTDAEVIGVLRKIKKELTESLDYAKKTNRQEIIEEYQNQLAVLENYLPQEMSETQLKQEIEKIIAENQELYLKNPNAVIGICVKKLGSYIDPARVVQAFRQITTA
ncbi:MAG: hypothetical protein KatS3mg091_820 [Patescibacteria group bacterium]|nr:MAG: hypothetical protein KatS3mg091_820 [Patescibacteria group bacterium]